MEIRQERMQFCCQTVGSEQKSLFNLDCSAWSEKGRAELVCANAAVGDRLEDYSQSNVFPTW
jgi:hypothetical protein